MKEHQEKITKHKARLAQALRTNLMRRKEQARQRRRQEDSGQSHQESDNQQEAKP